MRNAGYIATLVFMVIAAMLVSSREPTIDGTSAESFDRTHAQLVASVPLEKRQQLSVAEIALAVRSGCLAVEEVTDELADPERMRVALRSCRRVMHGLTYESIVRRAGVKATDVPLIPVLLAVAIVVVMGCWVRDRIKAEARVGVAQLALLLSLLVPISAGMLVISVRAIRDGQISIETRKAPMAVHDRERRPRSFWFWTGSFYLSGALSLGFCAGLAWHQMRRPDKPRAGSRATLRE